MFVRKIRKFNVDEIDTCIFTSIFSANILLTKNTKSKIVSTEKLVLIFLCKQVVFKILVKLTTSFKYTNTFRADILSQTQTVSTFKAAQNNFQ